MLHVLLLILKITGIVIACILGLVIIVVAAVLFVPVRYKADADYHGKFKAHAKLSWLGILRVLVSYDEELAIKAKALFITIYSNNQKKEKTSKHRTSKKKKTKHSEENIFSVNDDEAKKLTENEKKPQIKMAEAVSDTKEDTQAVKKNVEDIKESAESLKETVSKDEFKTTQNKNFFDKVKDKCFVIYTKIKEIINLVKDTVKKVSGAADKLKEIVTDEDNKALFHFFVEQLKTLIKVIRPKKYRINARLGFEDPATMGKVLAYISIFYGMSGVDLSLEPVFGENIKEGSIFLKGNIRIFSVLVIALRVYRNEQFKKFISR